MEAGVPPRTSEAASHSVRLLIVHHDPAFASAVRRVLDGAGYTVVECNDPEEALLRALRGEEYELILYDVGFSLDGALAFHERLAAMDPVLGARVVFLAGEGVEIPLSNPRIAQPFSAEALRTWITEFVNLRTQPPRGFEETTRKGA